MVQGRGQSLKIYREVNVIEEPKGSRVLWQPLEVKARVFDVSRGQWGVRSGAVVWYATEKRGGIEIDLCRPVDTGETRTSYKDIVEWLETKVRRTVKEVLDLDETETKKLMITSEVTTDQ